MRNNKLKSKTNGFTLIETLVAIFILSAALASPMVLSIKSIGSASVSRDQLVAFYLGQEVVEYVRNVRDTNLISGNNWLDGLTDCLLSSGPNGCYIDVIKSPATVTVCETNCPKLDFDGINYTYKLGGGDGNTIFTRTVKIDDTIGIGGDEAKISVSIEWTSRYGGKTMNLEDNLFNWR